MKKAEMLEEIEDLRGRLLMVEDALMRVIKDSPAAYTNIVHQSFWKRAFAVLGHYISAVFAIYLGIMVLALGVTLVDSLVNLFS